MSSLETPGFSEVRSGASTNTPSGTVTFLFTDIEGSTELLKRLREQYTSLLGDHRYILREIIAKWNGHEVDTQGDAFFFSFARATQAVAASVEAQRSIASHQWPEMIKLRVRMGLHTGEPWNAEEGYVGIDVHRAARIAHAGHGGQVLISETTAPLVTDELPQGVGLLDLGRHLLKDLRRPEHIHQLVIEGLPYEFPPLNSLGVLPSELSQAPEMVRQPNFLQSEGRSPEIRPVFVECNLELEKLDCYLQKALSSQGGIVFITGGPGQGKTALMNEFSWRVMELHPDLLVVKGSCNAYSGVGDPYLPFRDILAMFSGDLETRWSAGTISLEQARRLWKILPEAIGAILDLGPDLINRLVPGRDLFNRAQENGGVQPELLGRLQVLVQSSPPGLDQVALFGQFTSVLSKLAKRHPIVLILDDLQWIDFGSMSLLFHLGRRLAGSQILLVGAYRSEEVALGREGGRHPLEELLAEFKRQFGDIWIDLDNRDSKREQQFVEDLLETEPNLLSQTFRQALYTHTEGHPLFTIELLRNLQEQGDLARDERGRWVESEAINWEAIPSRVEGVIEERIGRLKQEEREILTIASVVGEDFTAQIIARILNLDERELLQTLSQSLDRQHHLIADHGIERVGQNTLFLFSFRHNLYQKYLYDRPSEPERVMLHKEVGEELETLFTRYTDEISPQLARHFDLAGLPEKAVQYYSLAGKYAMMISADHEAIAHFRRALHLLNTLPASSGRSQQELDLQLSLGPPLTAVKGWAAPELGIVYDRAQELCSELPDDPQLVRTLWLLAVYRMGHSEHDKVDSLIKQLSSIVQRTGDQRLIWMDKYKVYQFYQGYFLKTRDNLESVSRLYEPNQQRALAQLYGMAPSVVGEAYLSNCLWLLGFPEKALGSIKQALKRAEEVNVPLTTCYALSRSCWLYMQLDDFEATRAQAERLLKTCQEHHFKSFELVAKIYYHAAQVQAGEAVGDELEHMHQAIGKIHAMGTILNRTAFLVLFTEACDRIQITESGLAAASESIALGDQTGEQWIQAEAYRLKGELLIQQAANVKASYAEVESCFLRAYDIARSQAARSLELRAAISLLRLTTTRGDPDLARQRLKGIYEGFVEGLETPDLIEARRLLDA